MRTMLLLSLLGAAAIGCDKTNAAFCDAMNACPLGQTCNLVSNECEGTPFDLAGVEASALVDMATADLTPICATPCTGNTPVCDAPDCVGCDTTSNPEATCAAMSTTTPHCLIGDDAGTTGGACVACRTSAMDCNQDPAAAICDPVSHVCRGCLANSDCASLVCDLQFDSTHGRCVAGGGVIYADGTLPGPKCPGDGSFAHPFCKLTDATAASKSSGGTKPIVHATGTTYAESLNLDFSVTIIGDPGAVLQATGSNPALTVNGNGNTITVYGFTLAGVAGADVIMCNNGNPKTLNVLDCLVRGGGGFGINAGACTLNVDQSTIMSNGGGGIFVGQVATLTNNFIVQNGKGSGNGPGGVLVNSSAGAAFTLVNNTIADNTSGGGGANVGVSCVLAGSILFVNNILYNNLAGGTISESQCQNQNYVCTDDHPTGMGPNNVDLPNSPTMGNGPKFVSVNTTQDYHIQATSPCAKVGVGGAGIPTHDIDGQPRPNPTSNKVDIGADQN